VLLLLKGVVWCDVVDGWMDGSMDGWMDGWMDG
jgi:hypothetical protein